MTTDLMLRGSESRTIRQPPPAPCTTRRMRHPRNHHRQTPRRRFFPSSSRRRAQSVDPYRRSIGGVRGQSAVQQWLSPPARSASGGGTCGPTATSAIGPSTTSSRHRIHTASSWTRPSPWRAAARSRTTTAGPRTDGATPSKARTVWHGRASASPSSSPRAKPRSASRRSRPGRSDARTGSGGGE